MDNDYLLGQLSANVETLLIDVKEIKEGLSELKVWKTKIIIASSVCSVFFSAIFFLTKELLK